MNHFLFSFKTVAFFGAIITVVSGCTNQQESTTTTEPEETVIVSDSLGNSSTDLMFSKVLTADSLTFTIDAKKAANGQTEITVTPTGLSVDNRPLVQETYGRITNAEIADLNADGFPEILIFTESDGSGSYGDVIAYSVNNGKSVSGVYFPPTAEDKSINTGYMGHDTFEIDGKTLTQRFPVYLPGDPNANPTGGIRQVTYALKDGEASRVFVVKNVTALAAN